MSPRYQHDCDSCVFMGQFDRFDLWFCPKCDGGSAIARYGSDGPEYGSAPHFCRAALIESLARHGPHESVSPVLEAFDRAEKRGLLKGQS